MAEETIHEELDSLLLQQLELYDQYHALQEQIGKNLKTVCVISGTNFAILLNITNS